jgi:catechol 2,3-dioxygenase
MSPIDPALRIRSVELAVSDLPRSAEFYEGVLGLPLIERENGRALLGTDPTAPALVLEQLPAPTPLPPAATGLYHVAWLHPTREALAGTVRRVVEAGWRFEGASDHGVSEALYLSDPDGLGIEIYADRPRELWQPGPGGRGVAMQTLALDLRDLMAHEPRELQRHVAPATAVGHVHLKVSDVERARRFYVDVLGFQQTAAVPAAAFLAAGGYHHHLGLNAWQSAGMGPAPESAPALRRVVFALGDLDALDALERTAHEAAAHDAAPAAPARDEAGEVLLQDPDGELIAFAAAPG